MDGWKLGELGDVIFLWCGFGCVSGTEYDAEDEGTGKVMRELGKRAREHGGDDQQR